MLKVLSIADAKDGYSRSDPFLKSPGASPGFGGSSIEHSPGTRQ